MLNENFFINQPVFLKYKRYFDWKALRRKSFLKKVVVNERIVEIPFVIKELSAIPVNSKILDIGCMESELPLFISGLGYQVTGFDFREYPYKMPNFKFVKGDILNLPFDNNMFDSVVCVSTIEHVGIGFYGDPKGDMAPDIKGVQEIRRILKTKGLFILTVPFGKSQINKQQRIYDEQAVKKLLEGYEVKNMKYYKNITVDSGNNYWQETDLAEAMLIESISGADCICCVSAVNQE